MPKRSNMFQRLIQLIESALAARGAHVIESFSLRDPLNRIEREIDVLVEIPSGTRTLRIAIECRDHNRPATVEWIDELSGKYLYLPVDRVVAVSNSGFSKAAQRKAKIANIEILTLEDVSDFNWEESSFNGRAMAISSPWYDIVNVETLPPVLRQSTNFTIKPLNDVFVYRKGKRNVTLVEFLHWVLGTDEFIIRSMHNTWTTEPDAKLSCRIMTPDWFLKDYIGKEEALNAVTIELKGGIDVFEFWLQMGKYAGANVAYAEASVDDDTIFLVIVQEPSTKKITIQWYVTSNGKHPLRYTERLDRLSTILVENAMLAWEENTENT